MLNQKMRLVKYAWEHRSKDYDAKFNIPPGTTFNEFINMVTEQEKNRLSSIVKSVGKTIEKRKKEAQKKKLEYLKMDIINKAHNLDNDNINALLGKTLKKDEYFGEATEKEENNFFKEETHTKEEAEELIERAKKIIASRQIVLAYESNLKYMTDKIEEAMKQGHYDEAVEVTNRLIEASVKYQEKKQENEVDKQPPDKADFLSNAFKELSQEEKSKFLLNIMKRKLM